MGEGGQILAGEHNPGGASGTRVPKQQRSQETQETILAAALAIFSDHGYRGASTHEIAERAQVAQPLLMYHFPTKADLWLAVAQLAIDAFLERFRPRFEALEGLDPASKVRIVFQDYVRFAAERPELHKLMIDASVSGEPNLAGLVETRLRPVFELLRGEIVAAQKAGTMLPGDPVLLYYSLVGVAATVFSLRREVELLAGQDPREPETVEAQANLLAQLFFPAPRADQQTENKSDDYGRLT